MQKNEEKGIGPQIRIEVLSIICFICIVSLITIPRADAQNCTYFSLSPGFWIILNMRLSSDLSGFDLTPVNSAEIMLT